MLLSYESISAALWGKNCDLPVGLIALYECSNLTALLEYIDFGRSRVKVFGLRAIMDAS